MRTPCEDDGLDEGPRARTRSLSNSTEAPAPLLANPSSEAECAPSERRNAATLEPVAYVPSLLERPRHSSWPMRRGRARCGLRSARSWHRRVPCRATSAVRTVAAAARTSRGRMPRTPPGATETGPPGVPPGCPAPTAMPVQRRPPIPPSSRDTSGAGIGLHDRGRDPARERLTPPTRTGRSSWSRVSSRDQLAPGPRSMSCVASRKGGRVPKPRPPHTGGSTVTSHRAVGGAMRPRSGWEVVAGTRTARRRLTRP